ncbi:MAG: type VI secretion system protein TssA [Planctomycetes bacterium]|nr:type VI secretion system protein TssA [Planctomycetota bacterium]
MSSSPLLDIEALTPPIPGENPAGSTVPFTVRAELDEARKEINPDDFDADDPTRPETAKYADWDGVVRLATQILLETSKDLLVAARLTEALTRLHGFAGLRDGLKLMRVLIDGSWEHLHPEIEDGDLEVRAGPFLWLDDADRGARFPSTVREIAMFTGANRPYSWRDWRQVQDGRGSVSREELDQAILATTRDHCQNVAEDVDAALSELNGLTQALSARLGSLAPGFTSLGPAIGDCRLLVQQVLAKKGPAPSSVGEPEGAEEGAAAGGGPGRSGSREDIYRQLLTAAEALQEMEPHSPVPYLIMKAVELGRLPFPQLMQRLIREENVLTEMSRELGFVMQSGAEE